MTGRKPISLDELSARVAERRRLEEAQAARIAVAPDPFKRQRTEPGRAGFKPKPISRRRVPGVTE